MSKRPEVPSRVASPSDQLAALIRDSGHRPAALADDAGVAPSVLSRFLSGERGISSETFDRIAAALGGLRLVELTRRRGKPGPRPAP